MKKFESDDFCIIANNCWGAEVYKQCELPFNTPIIGLYFYPEDYLNFISDLRKNLETDVRFIKESKHIKEQKHPVGIVNEIEIHFLHYDTEEIAYEKWTKRCKRVLKDNQKLFFKFDDRDGATADHIHRFHQMELPNSICFTKDSFPEYPSNFKIPMPASAPSVMDGYDQFYVAEKYLSLEKWLSGNGIVSSAKQKILLKAKEVKARLTD
ncbi:MAG: hypothetical protein ACI9FU_000906 [Granulosicoccus sp.]